MADNGAVIDKLSIEIGSDISGAEKGLERLKKTLDTLKSIYSSVGDSAGDVSSKLKDLASGLNAFSSVDSSKVDAAVNSMKKLTKLDFSGLASIPSGVADGIVAIADGVNLFSMQIDGKILTRSLSALNKLREFDFQGLSMNIDNLDPAIAQKVRAFMQSFEGISGSFALTDSLESMRQLFSMDFSNFTQFMATAESGLPGLAQGITTFASACGTPEFDSAIEKLSRLANVDLGGLAQLSTSGFKVVPDISGQVEQETGETQAAIEVLKSSVSGMSSSISTGFGIAFSAMKYAASPAIAAVKSGFNSLKSTVDKATKGIGKFTRSIGRIALYRSIRFLFSQIAKGFKEGTDNLYQYSKAIDGQFAKSMDMLSTALLYFRNSVAAAAAPTINKLAPAIDYLVDRVVECLNWFNELTAKLTGASTWTKALKYPKEYAESTKDATKAMKDFQMGFDELNVISDTSAGKEEDGLDYSKMFMEMPTDIDFEPWADKFREALENADFYTAGAILGEKFNSIFDEIDAYSLGETLGAKINDAVMLANGFLDYADFSLIGKTAGEFLNGAFSEINFENIGHMLGQGINQIVGIVRGFVDTFDFDLAGSKVADFFNGLVDIIDFAGIGETIQNGLSGILTFFDRFLIDFDAKDLGQGIADIINRIDIVDLLGKFGSLFGHFWIDAFDLLTGFLQDVNWQKTGKDIFNGIVKFFEEIDWKKLTNSFAEFLGSALGAVAGLLWGIIQRIWENSWDLGEKIYDWLHQDGEFSWEGFLDGILKAIIGVKTWILDNIYKPFIDGFKKAFGINSPSTVMEEQGGYIIDGLKQGIINAWNKVKEWVKTNIFDPFINAFKTLFGINSPSTVMEEQGGFVVDGFKNGINAAWDSLMTAVDDAINKFKEPFEKVAIWLGDTFAQAWQNVIDVFSKGGTAFDGITQGISEVFTSVVNSLIDGINNAISVPFWNISEAIRVIREWDMGSFRPFEFLPVIDIPKLPRIEQYARGGYPDSGEIFMANENGVAEMVGRIGSRTAVANNEQIVDAMSEGVSAVLAEYIPQIIAAIQSGKNTTLNVDGRVLARAVNKANRESGVSIFGGSVVNA